MPSSAGSQSSGTVRQRRAKGEPRRLLIDAARHLFDRRGYYRTTTRDVAERADVAETLIFRHFGSKAGLFREAMVTPFVDAVDREIERMQSHAADAPVTREDTVAFVGAMYDVFRSHRALSAMVFAGEALVESEVAETGALDDVRAAIERWVEFASDRARSSGGGLAPTAHSIAIRGHLAMIAGFATLGSWYFDDGEPSRETVVDELTEWIWLRYAARG